MVESRNNPHMRKSQTGGFKLLVIVSGFNFALGPVSVVLLRSASHPPCLLLIISAYSRSPRSRHFHALPAFQIDCLKRRRRLLHGRSPARSPMDCTKPEQVSHAEVRVRQGAPPLILQPYDSLTPVCPIPNQAHHRRPNGPSDLSYHHQRAQPLFGFASGTLYR